jgi:hypothetical protein
MPGACSSARAPRTRRLEPRGGRGLGQRRAAARPRRASSSEVRLLGPDGQLDRRRASYSSTELLQLDLDGEINYRRPKFEARATANAVLTQQPEAEDTQRGSLTLSYTRLFSNRNRVFAQSTLEQNRELGFELRTSLVGGWSTFLARNARNELLGGAGLSVNREKPVEGESTTNLEAAFGFDYANFAYDYRTRTSRRGQGFRGPQPVGPHPARGERHPEARAVPDFYFGLKGYESFDSDPATEGAARNDWGLTLSLGYSF